jgi:pseudaminic acid cytidylyltransferase
MNRKVAIIPARGGSKRIPGKNARSFCGKPIIEYSIDAAIKSGCFDEIMVSTDDMKIAEIAKKSGAKVPFIRSEKTSDDYAMLADVIEEVLLEYKKLGTDFYYFCCILATAPFISSNDIANGLSILTTDNVESVVPVTRFSYPIQRSLKIESGKLKMFWPENYNVRSQDLTPAYHDCGQFYWMKSESLMKQKKLYATNTAYIEISESISQDVDTEEDWVLAELKYKMQNQLSQGSHV